MNANDQFLVDYLQLTVSMMGSRSLAGLVLEQGRSFKAGPLPKIYPRMKMNECFKNAFELASKEHLIYVEGYAHRIIPTLHAWCVDKTGAVIDPTWDRPEEAAYYGIPLKLQFVVKKLLKQQVYGLLGFPSTAGSMLTAKPSTYRVSIK